MLRTIGHILHAIWAVCAIAAGTFVGAALGLHSGGWIGAVAAAFPLQTIATIIEGL